MLAKATTHDSRRLARYLNLEAVIYAYKSDITIKAGQAVGEECPDCFRALDTLAGSQQLGIAQMTTFTAFPLLSKCLRERLEDVDGCPAPLVKRLKEEQSRAATGNAIWAASGGAWRKELEDEVDRRIQLVADLKAETASGRETGEPSLCVLGQMIEEIQLKHLIRRLEFERNNWGVPTDQTIASYRALTDHHRYAAYVDTFIDHNPDVAKTAETLFQKINPAEVTWMESALCSWLYYVDANRGKLLLGQAGNHSESRVPRPDERHAAARGQAPGRQADPLVSGKCLEKQLASPHFLLDSDRSQLERELNSSRRRSKKISRTTRWSCRA